MYARLDWRIAIDAIKLELRTVAGCLDCGNKIRMCPDNGRILDMDVDVVFAAAFNLMREIHLLCSASSREVNLIFILLHISTFIHNSCCMNESSHHTKTVRAFNWRAASFVSLCG